MPGQAAELVFDEATKEYPGRVGPAVDRLSLTVPAGEICVLVGPSGGGKTTALQLVNRLIPLTSGDIRIDGIEHRRPGRRAAAPGHRLRHPAGRPVPAHDGGGEHRDRAAPLRPARSWIHTRAHELLELVGLDASYANRYPAQLSGGERQRVGLARALAADPPIMLMDEPFAAIDPIVRARLQDEFLRLQLEVRKTVVFVTHDIDEAIKVGDRIAILRAGGKLAQYDTPMTILEHPADEFVAEFVGADRALKALALRTVAELELASARLTARASHERQPHGTRSHS